MDTQKTTSYCNWWFRQKALAPSCLLTRVLTFNMFITMSVSSRLSSPTYLHLCASRWIEQTELCSWEQRFLGCGHSTSNEHASAPRSGRWSGFQLSLSLLSATCDSNARPPNKLLGNVKRYLRSSASRTFIVFHCVHSCSNSKHTQRCTSHQYRQLWHGSLSKHMNYLIFHKFPIG